MNFFKKLFLITLVFVIIVILVITGLGFFMYKSAIDKTPISEKISKIKSDKNYVTIEDVPDNFKNAIIAIEDHRFRTHRGIDFITTTRSMLENIREKDIVAGGSTISQQLGRLLYFTQEKLFTRKIAELFVAFDLEKNYSKV